ncbi:cAMP-dependent protein kinase inhibitor beta [Apteryx mantelli]|uniref:cAMP-dependent protein kinase inhibitor n=1 Tax=Apteryx mantelli TaxID=2696672 RepID=A0A8B7JUF4_9AVES|nr:PREDICTED: cAMP-dependent protein kinase inhibitor beta [Apteryx mantelli mantelli]XP_013814616.1 PREDICTED: cAMP-dependent protein kinase inhibitor beta [Apteryx mantelli mantelli]XP_013814617.1 PREDICTED: cAMP-dependent protein kinase inhibitor beta [Apteryx mantelli mantelli]XP_025925171.1 cAMP-dependent protein kinase inhibitor beta [Apteryx rowi]
MTDVEPVVTDFAASGRAGRRNALPDILGSPAGAGTSDLPHKLAKLSVSEDEGTEGGEVSSSKGSLESQESGGKSSDS